jgi:hypothetical protein
MASNNFTSSFYVFFYAAVVPVDGRVTFILFAQGHLAVAPPESGLVVLGISFFYKIFAANKTILMFQRFFLASFGCQ